MHYKVGQSQATKKEGNEHPKNGRKVMLQRAVGVIDVLPECLHFRQQLSEKSISAQDNTYCLHPLYEEVVSVARVPSLVGVVGS